MRRRIEGLHDADQSSAGVFPDGLFLVRVERAQYRWRAQKPHYALRLEVLEPKELAGHLIAGRLYCTPKALWKLNWFLHDFGYDIELLERDSHDASLMISSPTSTLSDTWMAHALCSNGRRLPAAPGGTGWVAGPRSATGLLFLDDRHCRGRPGRIRPQAAS